MKMILSAKKKIMTRSIPTTVTTINIQFIGKKNYHKTTAICNHSVLLEYPHETVFFSLMEDSCFVLASKAERLYLQCNMSMDDSSLHEMRLTIDWN